MAEIVNLRRARKRARRMASETQAEKNRALHSIPASSRKTALSEREREARRLDAHRREPAGTRQDGDGDAR